MGWQLVQNLGERYVLQYGVLMSHKASGGFRGEFGGGSSQLDSRYHLWLRRLNMMDQKTVDRTKGKKTLKQYHSEYDNELWLNGSEAVAHGYADAVVSIKCDTTLAGTRSSDRVGYGFTVSIKYDSCPIRTSPISINAKLRTNKGYMSLNKFMETGGVFGKNCDMKGTKDTKDWRGNMVVGKEAQLCLMDRKLTLKEIQETVVKIKRKIRNKNNKIVKMSFGNFITDL